MSIDTLLAGHAESLMKLHEGHVPTWQPLLEHLILKKPEAAPEPFVEAALRLDERFERWQRRTAAAASACESHVFHTVATPVRTFERWFFGGLSNLRAFDSRQMLAARYALAMSGTDGDDLQKARSLAVDTGRVHGEGLELAKALLVLYRHATAARAHDEALASAEDAHRIFARHGLLDDAHTASRLCGGALLRLGRFEQAFAILDGVLRFRGPLFGGAPPRLLGDKPTPREEALDEAAGVAAWASETSVDWVRALGTLAHHVPEHAGLWGRFERALVALLSSSPKPAWALTQVLRQLELHHLEPVEVVALRVARTLGVSRDSALTLRR